MKNYIGLAGLSIATILFITDPGKSQEIEDKPTSILDYSPGKSEISYDSYNPEWKPSVKHQRAEQALAGIMFGECRGQKGNCMVAIGHVAMNRAKLGLDNIYGRGLWGVINKRKQFSCLNKSDPNRAVINKAIAGKLKKGSVDEVKWKLAVATAHDLMHRASADPTHGSTHYHSYAVKPNWMRDRGMVRIGKIDGHIFYRQTHKTISTASL